MVAIPNENLFNTSLITDDIAKISLLMDPQRDILNSLLNFRNQETEVIQHMKLDNLLILVDINNNTRNSIEPEIMNLILRIYSEISLYENLDDNSPMTNLKYMKLLNKCMDIGIDSRKLPYFSFFRVYFVELVSKLDYKIPLHATTATLIVELLKFFMLYDRDKILDVKLISCIRNMLLKFSDKYNDVINFKYTVTTRIPRTKGTGEESIGYNVIDNRILNTFPLPNSVAIDNMYEIEMIPYCLILISSSRNTIDAHSILWQNKDFKLFVESLLKHSDINLKCSALSFLSFQYFYFDQAWHDTKTINQIMPYLMQTFDSKILPWCFDPFENLIRLMEIYNTKVPMANPVIGFLKKTNLVNGFMELFFRSLRITERSYSTTKTLTQFIRLFACCTAFDEGYRFELLKNEVLTSQLKDCLKEHIGLLRDFIANRDIFIDLNQNLPQLHNSETIVAWLQLLKSFSRSTAALRTTLKKSELTKEVLDLLILVYTITKDCYFAGIDLLETELRIMGLALGILCNFIVEFSSVQNYLTDHGIVSICRDILTDPLFNDKQNWRNLTREMAFEGVDVNEIKTNTLWVLRHLMYNSQNQEKLNLLETINIDTILDYINDPCWSVQQQCFQVIKNLTCNSRKVVNILLEKYKNVIYKIDPENDSRIPFGSTYLFEFLARKMRLLDPHDISQRKTLEAILYIIVNIAAVNENKKELVIEQADILKIIHEILTETPLDAGHYGNNSELKLAALWILHNLLWDSNCTEFTQFSLRKDVEDVVGADRYSATSEEDKPSIIMDRDDDDVDDEDDDDDDDDENDKNRTLSSENVDEDFIRTRINCSTKALARCKILVELGFHNLVKKNLSDFNLNVKQKAASLLDMMDALLDTPT